MIVQFFVDLGCGYNAGNQIPEIEEFLYSKGYGVYTNETVPYSTLEEAECDLENK